MSSSIWTRCAGDSEIRPLRRTPWRVVESQHQVSTRKLVDSAAEQQVLEELIDTAKPPAVAGTRSHYLLHTPFRYPPLRHGSRFGGRRERAIWYGSETLRTAFAETAYYRLLFLDGTEADLGTLTMELTAFSVRARSARGIDLVSPPFAAHRDAIASPSSYAESQALGTAMREAGIELFRYPSARDTVGGVNVGVFTTAAFGKAKPQSFETWQCTATRERVEFVTRGFATRGIHEFDRGQFLVEGALPAPAP
jgi:hypothetical protein